MERLIERLPSSIKSISSNSLLDLVVIRECHKGLEILRAYASGEKSLEDTSEQFKLLQVNLNKLNYQLRIPLVKEGLTIIIERIGHREDISSYTSFCSCGEQASKICCNLQLCARCLDNHKKERHFQ